ncbi:MAG: hypothetical protein K8L99_33945 [Anaerolineae bacterium]|nr:hypothetical protein [Anaerolineae bacterium]
MDDLLLKILAVTAVFALIFGPLATRSSMRREPVYGGTLAKVFHFLGVTLLVVVLPSVLTALILGGGFRVAFPVGMTLLLSSLVMLVIFAVFERPARTAALADAEDRGWTEKDARTSGL